MQTVTLTGTLTNAVTDEPHQGRGFVEPTVPVLRDSEHGTTRVHGVSFDLDEDGSFSVTIPASDDPALNPTNVTYRVGIRLDDGTRLDDVVFLAPAAEPVLDYSDIAPIADPATVNVVTGPRGEPGQDGELGGFAPASEVPFGTVIPLDLPTWMPQQTLAAATTFTADPTPTPGAYCTLNLVSDGNGTHVPTLPGIEHGSSAGWANGLGYLNLVTVWHDGLRLWYSIAQPAGNAPVIAPTLSGAAVSDPANKIVLTYDINLDASSVPATSRFALTASGGAVSVSSVAIATRFVTLTLDRNVSPGETITLDYTPGSAPIQGVAGYDAAALDDRAVTNSVTASRALRGIVVAGALTETVAGGFYSYAETAGTASALRTDGAGNGNDVHLAANGYGFWEFDLVSGLNSGTSAGAVGIDLDGYPADDFVRGLAWVSGIINGRREATATVTVGTPTMPGTCRVRMGREVVGGNPVGFIRYSTDAGATWTTWHSWTATTVAWWLTVYNLKYAAVNTIKGVGAGMVQE